MASVSVMATCAVAASIRERVPEVPSKVIRGAVIADADKLVALGARRSSSPSNSGWAKRRGRALVRVGNKRRVNQRDSQYIEVFHKEEGSTTRDFARIGRNLSKNQRDDQLLTCIQVPPAVGGLPWRHNRINARYNQPRS